MGERVKNFISRYDSYLTPIALLAGFVWDNLTLRRIDLLFENMSILIYLAIAFFGIFITNASQAGKFKNRFFLKINTWVPFLLQFAFGGLFSAFIIFYSRSGSIYTSWPFILTLAFLFIGNELFKKKYQRLTFQLSVFFMALFSYSVFAVPILLNKIGQEIFLLSGAVSIVMFVFLIFILYKLIPQKINESKKSIIISVAVIYIMFNVLYFLRIIPPIPLSIKESGVYHSVVRKDSVYEIKYEKPEWYLFFKNYDEKYHWQKGSPVYNFTAVFSPGGINTKIFHRWYFFDEKNKNWILKDTLGFPIVGGRDGGYRGYSVKYQLQPGKWRVDTMLENGQVLGRNSFILIESEKTPRLYTEIK
ncbi:DUF2914 domain-containing protein [Candidatus Parcubacteria bacterium]|nr:MAG: DUF2914 domain-containing protein [Candidatus Parcubacteria bacterium]